MILHLRYRSVCRYAHSGRSFFLRRFPQICCQHVRCLFSMGYNTTAAACPCSHPVKTRSASRHLHTISHHFSTYNQQFYQNMCCFLLSFHKIHVSFLSCYVRLPKPQQRTEVKKGLQFFLQMLCCSKMTQKTRVQTERICIMLTGKTIILGVTGRNRRIQGGEPCQPFKETALGCACHHDKKCDGVYHTADV